MAKLIYPREDKQPLSTWSTYEIEKAISTLEAGQALWPDEEPLGTADKLYHAMLDDYNKELERRKQ